jgi:hypothetical protein
MKKSFLAIALAAALMLGGCSGFKSSSPPPTLYTLHAAAAPAQPAKGQKVVGVAAACNV